MYFCLPHAINTNAMYVSYLLSVNLLICALPLTILSDGLAGMPLTHRSGMKGREEDGHENKTKQGEQEALINGSEDRE